MRGGKVCMCINVRIIYIYIYIVLGRSHSFKHVSLNNKDKFCLYNLFKIFQVF